MVSVNSSLLCSILGTRQSHAVEVKEGYVQFELLLDSAVLVVQLAIRSGDKMDTVVQGASHCCWLAWHWKTNVLQAKHLNEDLSVCFGLILSPVFPDFLGILILNDLLVAYRGGELDTCHI